LDKVIENQPDLKDFNSNEASKSSEDINSNVKAENTDTVKTPYFKNTDFNSRLNDFISSKPLSKELFKEIGKEIINNDDLKFSENCLELAYNKVIEEKYRTLNNIIKDEKSLTEYIDKNQNIKNKIIKDYLNSINSNKNVHYINNNGFFNITSPSHPRTITDAGNELIKILK
jgi:hypothetical protein